MSIGFHGATAAFAFKSAFYDAIKEIMAGDPDTQYVSVTFGTPSTLDPDDVVSFMGVTSEQNVATIGNRGRDEILTLEVQISCMTGGDDEQGVQDRAYQLLGIIEEYARKKDPTIGGTVMWCFLSGHESAGFTDPADIAKGRAADILARFTAQARISL